MSNATLKQKTRYPIPRRSHVQGTIYLLCFCDPLTGEKKNLKHAAHYLGWTENLEQRIEEHRRGNGSKLVAAATRAGIGFRLTRIWKGDRYQERRIKSSGKSKVCPYCNKKLRRYECP